MLPAFVLILYISLTVYTSYKISRSFILSRQQKIVNVVINCLLPLLWYFLISPVIFQQSKLITKDEREKMLRKSTGSNEGESFYGNES